MTLTEAEDGHEVVLAVGDELVVLLDENPTTGYRWAVTCAEGFELAEDSYEPAQPMAFGSGGRRELHFRATAAGRAELELSHRQEWEGEGSARGHFRARALVTG